MPSDVLPSTSPEEITETIGELISQPHFWNKLLYAAVLLVCCIVVTKILTAIVDRAIVRFHVEKSLHAFIRTAVKILLWFITVVVVLSFLGIDPTSLIAVLSVVGLAVSLAIQGTLSNLAGGMLILATKPFKVGDYIEAGGVSGTVMEIGMVYTKMQTVDNKTIFVPNGEISAEKITNYNAQTQRRVDLKFSVSYDAPLELVKNTLGQVVRGHQMVLTEPEPLIRVNAYNDSSIEYIVRAWCATENYWDVYFDLMEQAKAAFDRGGIEMTYNHLNVHILEK